MTLRPMIAAALLLLAGCRDLIEPGAVARTFEDREVEGVIVGFDELMPSAGNVIFDTRPYAIDGLRWSAALDGDRFRLILPRGTDGLMNVFLEWLPPTDLPTFAVEELPLRGRRLEIPFLPRHVRGTFAFDDGHDPAVLAGAPLVFAQAGLARSQDRGRQETVVAAEGGFETVLAEALWDVELTHGSSEPAATFDVVWRAVTTDSVSTLVVPARRRPFELQVPLALPGNGTVGLTLDLFARTGPLHPRVVVTQHWPATATTVTGWWLDSGWMPEFGMDVPSGDGFLFGAAELREPDDPQAPVTIDLGRAVVRVRVTRGLVPLPSVSVRFLTPTWQRNALTGTNGVLWITQQPGVCRIEVSVEPDRTVRVIEVADYAEVDIDLPPLRDVD